MAAGPAEVHPGVHRVGDGAVNWYVVRALRRRAGARVYAPEAELSRVCGRTAGRAAPARAVRLLPYLWRPTSLGFVVEALRQGFLAPRRVGAVEPVRDGQELDVPGRLRALATPGHTEGHLGYLLAGGEVLFSGDALLTRDPLTGARGPRIPSDVMNNDLGRARASLAVVAGSGARIVLPGHGEPWRDGADRAAGRARRLAVGR